MKSYLLIFIFLLTLNLSYAKDITYKVIKGGTADAVLNVGSIKVSTWDKDEIKISVSEEDAKLVKVTSNGNTIRIIFNPSYATDDIHITVPDIFNLKLLTNAGDVRIENNLTGNVNINTSGGDVTSADIKGDMHVTTGGGDVRIGNVSGNLNVNSSGGNVRIKNVDKNLVIKCSGGDINVENVTNKVSISTGGGTIRLSYAGGIADVVTGGGDIFIGQLQRKSSINTAGGVISINSASGELLIQSTSGDIIVKDLIGSLKGKTLAGDIRVGVGRNYNGFSYLSTENGDIRAVISSDANVKVNVKLRGSSIFSEEDIQETIKSEYKFNTISKHGIFIESSFDLNEANYGLNFQINNGSLFIKKK